MDIIDKTTEYIKAFDAKDLNTVCNMLDNNITLFDPANPNGILGINDVKAMIKNLFDNTNSLAFTASNIFIDSKKQVSIIEFTLKLDDKVLKGTDIIEWNKGVIKELRAYLY